MTLFGGMFTAGCIWLLGRALLPSRGKLERSFWEEQCLAWLLGAAGLPLAAMAVTLAGIRFDGMVAWMLLLAAAVAGILRLRADRRSGTSCSPLPLGRGAALLLGILGVGSVAATLLLPLNEFDALFHFAFKGKILFFTGNPLDPAFTDLAGDFGRIQTHPNYPLGIPFLEAFAAHAGGGWSDRWVQIPLAFWAASLPGVVALGLRAVSARAAARGALLAACLPILYTRNFVPFLPADLADVPRHLHLTLGGGADLALAALFAGACALLLRARRSGSPLTGALAGVLLAGAVFTKNEGLALAGVLALALLAGAPRSGTRAWKATAAALGIAALLSAPWLIHRAALPDIDENYAQLFTLERAKYFLTHPEKPENAPSQVKSELLEHPPMRLPLILGFFGTEFVRPFHWGLLWILFVFCLPLGGAFRDAEARWLALLVLGGLLLYALVMLVTNWWVIQLHTTGIPERLLLHLAGPAALLVGRRLETGA